MFFFCNLRAYYSRISLYSYFWLIFICVYHDFLCYPDPDPLILRWIRIRPNRMIRIRPDLDPKHWTFARCDILVMLEESEVELDLRGEEEHTNTLWTSKGIKHTRISQEFHVLLESTRVPWMQLVSIYSSSTTAFLLWAGYGWCAS